MNPEQRLKHRLRWEHDPASQRVQKNKVRSLFEFVSSKSSASNEGPTLKFEGYSVDVSGPLEDEGRSFTVRDDESRIVLAHINIFLRAGKDKAVLVANPGKENETFDLGLDTLISANTDDVDDIFLPQEGNLEKFNPALAILETVLIEHIETDRTALLAE